MSGPKVVRIVTRDEIIAICRSHLAQLDAAIASWRRDAEKLGDLMDAEVEAVLQRRAAIAELLARDQFMELQKAAPEEIDFLKSDRARRRRKAVEAKRRARTLALRQVEAARALVAALRRSGSDMPVAVIADLEAAIAGKGDVAAAMSAGFARLSGPSASRSSQLSELAQNLKGDSAPRLLADWMSTQPPPPDQAQLDRLEARIEALEALGEKSAPAFEARLDALRDDRQSAPRCLALDSLLIDVDQALAVSQRRADLIDRIEFAQAELSAIAPRPPQDPAFVDGDPIEVLANALVVLEQEIAAALDAQAAEARRRAVLEGLAALGYETGAEMSTAWVRDGKVVLRRPAQPGYGVEVMGSAQAERLQMRVVAFDDSPPDKSRDRDAEVLWCGDVEELSERLSKAGSALVIEKALPIGATPVKRVAAGGAAPRPEVVRAPKSRIL